MPLVSPTANTGRLYFPHRDSASIPPRHGGRSGWRVRRQTGDLASRRSPSGRVAIASPMIGWRSIKRARISSPAAPTGTKNRSFQARHRRLSAGASMSRCCARKAPQTQRPRASGSSAARPTTARGGPSRSSACRGLSKRRPPPRRGRNAARARTLASAADANLKAAPARLGASLSGPSEGGRAQGANGRRVRPIRRVGLSPRGQMREGLKAARASAASIDLPREAMAIAEMGCREHGAPASRRASASLIVRRAGRVLQPERAGRHDRTAQGGRARTSSRDRLARACATETGHRAAVETRAARARRRGSGALIVPMPSVTVIVESGRSPRGAAEIPRANASLTGRQVGAGHRLAKVERRDRTTRAGRVQTSNQDRRAQERVTEIGRKAPPRPGRQRRTTARSPSRRAGALPRGKDRRKAPAVHAGHRGSRDRCKSSAAASRAARC